MNGLEALLVSLHCHSEIHSQILGREETLSNVSFGLTLTVMERMNRVRGGWGIRSEKVKTIIIIHETNSDNFDFS